MVGDAWVLPAAAPCLGAACCWLGCVLQRIDSGCSPLSPARTWQMRACLLAASCRGRVARSVRLSVCLWRSLCVCVCVGAPVVLPDYLQPSIPTKSNAPWKNKDQRAAAQAAKVAASKGLPPPPPPMPTPEVRWLRLPLDGTELPVLPAVLPDGEQERQACSLEEYGSDLPQDSSLAGLGSPPKRKWASGGSGKQKKQRAWGEGDEDEQEEGVSYSAAPHSQEARDAKSGKGRKRLFLHPIIRTRDRCGKCSVSGSARCCLLLDLQSLWDFASHRCRVPALLFSRQRGQHGVGPPGPA